MILDACGGILPRPKNAPTGAFLPGGTQSAGHGLFESHLAALAKFAAKIKSNTPQGAAFGADGGIRTHVALLPN